LIPQQRPVERERIAAHGVRLLKSKFTKAFASFDMKKLKIITAFDSGYEIGHLALPTHMLYASLYGYSFEKFDVANFDRPPAWFKVKALLDELDRNEHEFVLWVDADAFVVDFGFDFMAEIGNHLDSGKSLYLCSHFISNVSTSLDFLTLAKSRINTGVMLVRNTDHARALLRAVWEKTEYMNHSWWEQAALMDLLGYKMELNGDANSNKRSERFFEHVGALPAYMNCIPAEDHMHGSETMAPVIIHLAGIPGRMEIARNMLKNMQLRITNRKLTKMPTDLF